ncbi:MULTISPECIES: phosphoenolpyruvate--protein phosphotransferase [unclassified Sphingobium]|uniref:phosphoenolpyruvate--protein phosphotransferase n=1 Tax=unclassified Sphingobium TaxID=2611147 RepID=UPI000D16D7AF|nr:MULTISPECIES: phosphoenolpyruvate--protein phosphotransferase [unclassified Sphingobium]MBG6120499.1 phosphocarrier protein FPr [Sphingobium sp. JAI105]PSO09775.1 phosphoenolpyruvate--protein phosphotransferase [Sphingobium sp. AEW4]TWD20622.1 phosphocarrier protein HPr /phosphoenolpyruvate--protein phosphotransferase /PTS system D-fructose-specific IIA component (F1P-forming) (Frc family) [Sphingobium sp. AEW001]TWC98148.1 phosphocarrier protein HPr /phosphoenolpyruvate--protein phosphotran
MLEDRAAVAQTQGNTHVRVNATAASKEDAIRQAGQLLVAAGVAEPDYVRSMLSREDVANTYLGSGVAIPHGLKEDRALVRRDGIAVLQLPDGVEWNPGETARLVVGIAANSDGHIAILRRLTRLIQDETRLEALIASKDPEAIARALEGEETAAAPAGAVTDYAQTAEWTVDYPAGLHARPASAWVETAKGTEARLRVRHENDVADPRSLISLLQLGLREGDRLIFSAEGKDARAALDALVKTARNLTARERRDAELAAEKQRAPVTGWKPAGDMAMIAGVAASPGIAIGTVHILSAPDPDVPDIPVDLVTGGAELDTALTRTRAQMKALIDDTTRRLGAADAAIFRAQAGLLDDTDLITLACQLMVQGHGVAWSWYEAVGRVAGQLSALGNPVLAARAADLHDVGRRVLAQIDPSLAAGSLDDLPEGGAILVASDLSPSDTATLDPVRVAGIATALGGPTSHSAILSRTLGLPSVVAGGARLLAVASGTTVIVDGDGGRVWIDPSEADLASARAWIAAQQERRAAEEAERGRPATTTDGVQIEIAANVNRPDQVPFALAQGGEAVGLMRTEFLFLEAGHSPEEDEQYVTYRGMIDALEGRPLIVRALDIGGDKQVPHLNLPEEENPFLGVRGARLLLRRPDLLDPQLRALYRAAKDAHAEGGGLSIMFPMITSVWELVRLRERCEEIRAALDAPKVPVGIMIEVPAAAVQARALAQHADFFSVGTNDLTQYVLAIDRQSSELAAEADSLHPAVLNLIATCVEGAKAHGRPVGVCGGIAGDPFGAALLAGLGVGELSMTPRDIPAVKARLRCAAMADLRDLAQRALAASDADEVRGLDEQNIGAAGNGK